MHPRQVQQPRCRVVLPSHQPPRVLVIRRQNHIALGQVAALHHARGDRVEADRGGRHQRDLRQLHVEELRRQVPHVVHAAGGRLVALERAEVVAGRVGFQVLPVGGGLADDDARAGTERGRVEIPREVRGEEAARMRGGQRGACEPARPGRGSGWNRVGWARAWYKSLFGAGRVLVGRCTAASMLLASASSTMMRPSPAALFVAPPPKLAGSTGVVRADAIAAPVPTWYEADGQGPGRGEGVRGQSPVGVFRNGWPPQRPQ